MKLRKHHGILLSLILSVSLLGGTLFATSIKDEVYTPTFATYTNGDAATYYNGISDSLTGDDLLSALRSLNSSKRKSTVGYDGMGTTPSGQFKYTDYDPNTVQYDSNHQPYGTKLISFYSGNSATSGMNREHVWPNSHGGNVIENDIHMPRPTLTAENGSRGNSFYVEGKCSGTAGWDPAMESFGVESYRGDSARIIFYCMLVDSRLSLIEADSHSTSNNNKDYMMGRLSHMVKWHLNYAPLQREMNRNEGAEYLQGNRNPFIDHPEYVCRIWGNANSDTQALCANDPYENHGSGTLTISKTTSSLLVDETTTISATSSDNSNITWSSSNTTVATVSASSSSSNQLVTITALSAGTSTISATAEIDGYTLTRTCLVTVTSSGSGGGDTPPVTPDGEVTADIDFTSNKSSDTDSLNVVWSAKNGYTTSSSYIRLSNNSSYISNETPLSIDTSKSVLITIKARTYGGTNGRSIKVAAYNSNNQLVSNEATVTPTSSTLTDFNVTLTFTSQDDHNITIKIMNSGTGEVGISELSVVYDGYSSGSGSSKSLSYIIVYSTDVKKDYTVGDTFVKPRVDAYYEDGDSDTVTEQATFTGYNMSVAGEYTVTVSYTLGSKTETDTYTITVNPAPVVLSSISLSGQQTKFTTGDEFVFGGTVTAHYSNNTTADVTEDASFTGYNMSAAGNQTVTVSYGGKTATYSITLTNKITGITSYTTEVTRIFHPGEFLNASNITVEDSNGNQVTGFEFDLEGHQITYEDSYDVDGSSHYKTFNNCIHWNGFTCNYAVRIERVAYVEPTPTSSVTDTIVANDLPATTTSYTDFTGVTKSSGAEYAGNSAKDKSGNIQLRSKNSNSGIVSTVSGGPIKSVTITVGSGSNQVDIYGKNTAYSSANDLYGNSAGTLVGSVTSTGTVTFETQYAYVGIRSNNGALYLSSIAIEYGSGEVSESPVNVSNYIMYENTNNQCLTKLDIALEKLNTLSQSDKNTFMTSNDYVIKCARERIQAWARNQDKEFELNDNNFVINSNNIFNGDNFTDEGSTNLIIIICALSLVSTISLLVIKKRKNHK